MYDWQGRRRSGLRAVTIGLMAATFGGFALVAAGCGGSSGGGSRGPAQGLWVPNFEGQFVSEFTSSMLKNSGSPAPAALNLSSDIEHPWGAVFDSSKDLWVSNVTLSNLTMFTFAQLKALGTTNNPTAAVTISGLDRPEGLAFDRDGNLWVANEDDSEILEFTPSQLATSGSPIPNTIVTSGDLHSPVGIAFDGQGALWIANDSSSEVVSFTAKQLQAGGAQPATVVLTSNGSNSLDTCQPVAFDRKGNLWVGNLESTAPESLGSVVAFSPSQLSASGSPDPIVTITPTPVGATSSIQHPTGLAFDRGGNLWVANDESDTFGSLAKFTTKQLSIGGALAPSVFLDSDAGGDNLNSPFLITFGPSIKF
jgi:sugar lactone lactonase YvrE